VRVLVAGMGSAIGTGVALALEKDARVEAITGCEFKPTVVVHAWVFEPRARSSPGQARARTVAGTETLLGAISKVGTVEHLAVRSGVSVYGTGRGTPSRPNVDTLPRPTSTFGDMLSRVEERCNQTANAIDATVAAVRLAPIMASHLPNPLGRYLRLPVVPVPLTTNRFGVVHLVDASATIAAAATHQHDGPLNVMASGAVTPIEAITVGRRIPLPVLPPVFRLGRVLAEIPGTPVPEHVAELLSKGGVVEPSDLSEIGITMSRTTKAALKDLYSAGRLIDVDTSPVEAGTG